MEKETGAVLGQGKSENMSQAKSRARRRWRLVREMTRRSARIIMDKCRSVSMNRSMSVTCTDKEDITERRSSGWKVHTWSTFIARVEEERVKVSQGKLLLSPFQQDKFIHFFYHVLDVNRDHVISQEDFDGLNDRVRHYMDWSVSSIHYLTLAEVHTLFIEHFLGLTAQFLPKDDGFDFCDLKSTDGEEVLGKVSVSIDEWVEVWGETVGNARKMDDLPLWLQYYPKTLFNTINRSGTGIITKQELKLFYTAFLDAGKLADEDLEWLTEKSFAAMTTNGDVELSFHMYKLSFLNFLLGKQPNGPGQWIFGSVETFGAYTSMFQIDYNALNSLNERRKVCIRQE